MSMKKRVRIETVSLLRLPVPRGVLCVDPGTLHGLLSIRHFTKAGYDDPPGFFLVGLQWNTPKGTGADYTAVVCATSLLPIDRASRITARPPLRSWDFVPAMALDNRSEYEFEITDEQPLRGRWKYTTIQPYMYFQQSTVLIKLALNTDDPRADRGMIVLEYTLPLDVLLWRKAPRLLPNEVLPEKEPWVDVEELSTPIADLPNSPVWIER